MLDVNKLIASAEECVGWPYVSPGTNDSMGIDCSGLFVKCFKDQGGKILHGSNTIYRKYCSEKGKLTSIDQLLPGMAVFKHKPTDTTKYPDGLGDFYHIGMVTSVKPLRIVQASSVSKTVIVDSKLGKWVYWGWLKDVAKEGTVEPVKPVTPAKDATLPTIKKGCKGEYVQLLQSRLMMLGYDLGSYGVDGDFGKATDAAVKKFQTDSGLKDDGIVGPLTWDALNKSQKENLYTVTISHLHLSDVRELEQKYKEIKSTLE